MTISGAPEAAAALAPSARARAIHTGASPAIINASSPTSLARCSVGSTSSGPRNRPPCPRIRMWGAGPSQPAFVRVRAPLGFSQTRPWSCYRHRSPGFPDRMARPGEAPRGRVAPYGRKRPRGTIEQRGAVARWYQRLGVRASWFDQGQQPRGESLAFLSLRLTCILARKAMSASAGSRAPHDP